MTSQTPSTSLGSDHAGLRFIFALFLGLMVTTFIGVGVATFRPSPADRFGERITALQRERGRLETAAPENARTSDDRRALQDILVREAKVQDEQRLAMRRWLQETSVILILFATLVMAIAVWRAERLPVIGNGLLLGGVFTMLYGAGMAVIATETMIRFLVITGALGVTIILGYRRFVGRGEARVPSPVSTDAQSALPSEALAQRVTALEDRLRELGAVLTRQK